jgi:hypothetical protein
MAASSTQDLASGSRSRTVIATSPAPACGTPSVAVVSPLGCRPPPKTPVSVTVNATDPSGISNVTVTATYTGNYSGGPTGSCVSVAPVQEASATATGGPTYTASLNVVAGFGPQPKCYRIDAVATNSCGQSATASGTFQQANYFCTGGYPRSTTRTGVRLGERPGPGGRTAAARRQWGRGLLRGVGARLRHERGLRGSEPRRRRRSSTAAKRGNGRSISSPPRPSRPEASA